MTPKEKAEEIFNKYIELHKTSVQMKFRAIDSSLFLVDEMLKVISTGSFNEKFYKDVKAELEKL